MERQKIASRVLGLCAVAAAAGGLGYLTAARGGSPDRPPEDVAAALAEPDELERAAGLIPVLASLDADDLDAVVDAYEATFVSVGPGEIALELLCEAWVRIDPEQAFRRIETWGSYWRYLATPFLMRSWAQRDVDAAREAVARVPPDLQPEATAAVIRGWADSPEPGLWEGYLAALPFGEDSAALVLQHLVARDGVGAMLERARALPGGLTPEFERRVLLNAVIIASQSDPVAGASFVESQLETPWGETLQAALVSRWVTSDGSAAMQWLLQQPAGHARDRALRAGFRNWFRDDPAAALGWADSQTDEVMAPALDLYATAVAEENPERAAEIALRIPEPARRQRSLGDIGRAWLQREPDAARAWFGQAGLDAELVPEARPAATATQPARPRPE